MRLRLLPTAVLLLAVIFAGCTNKDPIQVGFVGGLSDRVTDTGRTGQNGVQLAIEEANRAGGVDGRMLALVSRDDAQSAETAAKSAGELVAAKVEAVIGPFSSSMAAAVLPVFERARILVISPTITSLDFYGRDDHLVRINRTTRDNARDYARVLLARGQKRVAVAWDTRNRVFTESWLREFRAAIERGGGEVAVQADYLSRADADFASVVAGLVGARPDGLLFIAPAADVARLAQQARRLAPKLPLTSTEWAGTEELIELGGSVVDGMLIVQNFNRDDASPRYQRFRDAYFKRFQQDPGYSSVMSYDAATVLIEALRKRKPGQSVKEAVLANGPYQGLQQAIAFDANGDTDRQVYFTEIRDRRFQLVK